mgnify:CR=1 FL=1
MVRVLVVEDEANIREMIALNLRLAGMEAVEADSAEAALPLLEQKPGCDAAILDVMLPGMNGFSLCETIRRTDQKIGIIILSAKGQEQDKIRGLSIGADDYMTKPPDKTELLLRIKALLRRARIVDEHKSTVGDVVVDMDSHTVRRGMEVQTLPPKEFELLYKLLAYPERTFTRMELLDEIWGIDSESDDKTVNVHINRLRNRFYDWPEFEIQTVRGLGYRAVKKV